MSKPTGRLDTALGELHAMEDLAQRESLLTGLHPGTKVLVTVLYILTAISFPRDELSGLLALAVYPLVLFQAGDLSFGRALYRCRVVLPLVLAVGIANPFLDRRPLLTLGSLTLTYGMLSMGTLMVKGVLSVLASYLLIASTPMEKICRFLRSIHVPAPLVVELLLIYRYITLFLTEARRVVQAYHLRAPGQRGIAPAAVGSLLGQMLLRTVDRGEALYQSMTLRGFTGDFAFAPLPGPRALDALWLLLWAALFFALRFLPVLEMLGGLFVPGTIGP